MFYQQRLSNHLTTFVTHLKNILIKLNAWQGRDATMRTFEKFTLAHDGAQVNSDEGRGGQRGKNTLLSVHLPFHLLSGIKELKYL